MSKFRFKKLLAAATLSLSAMSANAGLLGDSVFGTLAFGGPASPFGQFWVPQTATVGAGVEFFYTDGANDDSADFSNGQVVIRDLVKSNANGWVMTFKTPDFLGATVTELTDGFTNGGVNFSLVGDLLTFTWVGTNLPEGELLATYQINTGSTVPEPSSLALLGLALAGVSSLRRRRQAN